jgi:hypothetical protein
MAQTPGLHASLAFARQEVEEADPERQFGLSASVTASRLAKSAQHQSMAERAFGSGYRSASSPAL